MSYALKISGVVLLSTRPILCPGSASRRAPTGQRHRRGAPRLVACPGTRSGRASSTRRRSSTRAGARRSQSSLVRSPWRPARAAVIPTPTRRWRMRYARQRSLDAEGQHRTRDRRRARARAARPMRSKPCCTRVTDRAGSRCSWRRSPRTATAPAPTSGTSSRKNGGSLGEPGSVAYLFEKKGMIVVDASRYSEDELMAAVEAGAEDIVLDEDVLRGGHRADRFPARCAARWSSGRGDGERRRGLRRLELVPLEEDDAGRLHGPDREARGQRRRRAVSRELRHRRRRPRTRRRLNP